MTPLDDNRYKTDQSTSQPTSSNKGCGCLIPLALGVFGLLLTVISDDKHKPLMIGVTLLVTVLSALLIDSKPSKKSEQPTPYDTTPRPRPNYDIPDKKIQCPKPGTSTPPNDSPAAPPESPATPPVTPAAPPESPVTPPESQEPPTTPPVPIEPPTPPSNMHISREYYDLCRSVVDEVVRFMKDLEKEPEFMDFLNNIEGIEEYDKPLYTDPWNSNGRVYAFVFRDLFRCYEHLGHDIDETKKEFLPYIMMNDGNMFGEYGITYENAEHVLERDAVMVGATQTLLSFINSPQLEGDYDFIVDLILSTYGATELRKRFNVVLYRFASVVAKADGNISKQESDWLAGLLAARDDQQNGDTTADSEEEENPSQPTDGTGAASKNENAASKKNAKSKKDKAEAPRRKGVDELDDLIGLDDVKSEVRKLANFVTIQHRREENGLRTTPVSYHCVFTGNPGTGKTTVARIIADIYRDLGVLKKGHLVETDRSGLVAEYVGQTAVKTNKIINSALDGVLFIDEAYSLVRGTENDFGPEAVATLLKRMEDDRGRLVVILAGYGDEMRQFIDSNPGLQSRFNRYIHFPDYQAEDLCKIFSINVGKHDYVMDQAAQDRLAEVVRDAVEHKDKNFGNARFVRNLFERTLENQATRLAPMPTLTREDLQTLLPEDIG